MRFKIRMAERGVEQIQVEGISKLLKALEEHKGKTIFLMFTGAIDESGDSWCSDCKKADPVIEKGLEVAPAGSVFIIVVVGDRPTWKKADNEFRTSEFKLQGIPTLMQYGTPKRLGPEECSNPDLVNMMFEEA